MEYMQLVGFSNRTVVQDLNQDANHKVLPDAEWWNTDFNKLPEGRSWAMKWHVQCAMFNLNVTLHPLSWTICKSSWHKYIHQYCWRVWSEQGYYQSLADNWTNSAHSFANVSINKTWQLIYGVFMKFEQILRRSLVKKKIITLLLV